MNVYDDDYAIPLEDRNRVFNPLNCVLGTEVSGTGLGMVINKTFAKKWFND